MNNVGHDGLIMLSIKTDHGDDHDDRMMMTIMATFKRLLRTRQVHVVLACSWRVFAISTASGMKIPRAPTCGDVYVRSARAD